MRLKVYGVAAAGVALCSAAIGAVLAVERIDNISLLYLLVILAVAIRYGRWPGVFACVVAFLIFDWFFIPPIHTFTIADPEEWLALCLFLVVSVVASQLAVAVRQRAQEARRREREAVALHTLGRLLNAQDRLDAALPAVLDHLQRQLDLVGCAVLVPPEPGRSGPIAERAAKGVAPRPEEHFAAEWVARSPRTGSAGAVNLPRRFVRIRRPDRRAAGEHRQHRYRSVFVPLTAVGLTVGMLRLTMHRDRPAWTPEEERLIGAASEQIGRAVERDRLRGEATAAEVLRQTDEVRRAVLAAVSHDLRTPLASIKGSAESLLQPGISWSEDERQAFLVAIRQQAEHLHRLVENLLDLSRIEAGELRPERDWYPLDSLVQEVLTRLDTTMARHPVTVDVPDDLPAVPLDYIQISQVLINLLENAAKYTPPGTPIHVVARREREVVSVTVEDDGPGIARAAQPHVFEKFYRVSGGDRAAVKGTGVGLAVAKGFVEAHGGVIEVLSPPPGRPKGTAFRLTLPLSASELGASPGADDSALPPVPAGGPAPATPV